VPPQDPHFSRIRWLIVIFFTALLWRGAAIWAVAQASWFAFVIGDAATYDEWARTLAGGDWVGKRTFYQAPLYPYCLGIVYATLSDKRLVIVILQALLGAASAVLLCDAGWRWFSKWTGIVAGLLLATYAPAIFFDLLIQKSSLDLFLVCWQLWLLSRISTTPRPWLFLTLGLASGLLALNRENAIGIAFILAAWLLAGGSGLTPPGPSSNRRGRVRPALWFIAGLVVALAPAAIRNRAVGGEWHLTTSQFGPNFYIGNHAGATGTYSPLATGGGDARFERRDAQAIAETALGRNLSDAEVSSYWTRQALQFIRSEPAAWSRLILRKGALFWNHAELTDTEDVYTYAERSLALRVPGSWLNFGVIATLAAGAIWCLWGRFPIVRLLLVLILAYSASVTMFYVVARYRLPVVPWLMLLSAAGVVHGASWLRGATWMQRSGCIGSMVAMALLAGCPLVDVDRQRTATHLNFGAELTDRGRWMEAVDEFQSVLALNPAFAEAHFNLGTAYAALGRLNEAAPCFRRALELDPRFALASLNLGNVALDLGDAVAASKWFTHTLQIDPREFRAYNGLGMAAAATGDWDRAIACFTEAVRLAPNFVPAQKNLEHAKSMRR
jgi:tetratricopeptide (TPR) repeat protein